MQANDMLRSYDDRDDFEIAQAIKRQREASQDWQRRRTVLTIEDVPTGKSIITDGGFGAMLLAYVTWAKLFIEGTRKEGEPCEFRMTLAQGDGTIIRTHTFKRGESN